MSNSPIYQCPIPATHDKFREAHYFLHRLMEEYHEPEPFRWNLNAFLQALRSVEHMLKAELGSLPNFDQWYKQLEKENLIKNFIKGRNFIVHEGMLKHKSRVVAGIFRDTVMKTAFDFPIDINIPSKDYLEFLIDEIYEKPEGPFGFFSMLIDKNHAAIGEQLGLQRTWIVEKLGNENVFILCNRAWSRVSQIVLEAHNFAGANINSFNEDEEDHNITRVSIILESDLDPTLPDKWGW